MDKSIKVTPLQLAVLKIIEAAYPVELNTMRIHTAMLAGGHVDGDNFVKSLSCVSGVLRRLYKRGLLSQRYKGNFHYWKLAPLSDLLKDKGLL